MSLADFIEANKQRVIERWALMVDAELPFDIDESQLVNDLPDVLDDLVTAARDPTGHWPDLESARSHGRQRMKIGFNLGRLTVEMTLIGEAVLRIAEQDGQHLSCEEIRRLFRVIGRGTEASVEAYSQMRDHQLAHQASQHFSFIAHEIRTPLQTAKLAAMLSDSVEGEARRRYVERLGRSLERLSELVDNSLTEARLLDSPVVKVERLDAEQLVEDSSDDVATHAETRGVELDYELESFEFDGDRKLLKSALTNLFKNAVKFTHEHSRVTIRARTEHDRAKFEVEDECGGIPTATIDRLFEPFVQANDDDHRGFGLGLAIVKQAIDAHGGTVQVDNIPGHGCRFIVDLPRRQPTSES